MQSFAIDGAINCHWVSRPPAAVPSHTEERTGYPPPSYMFKSLFEVPERLSDMVIMRAVFSNAVGTETYIGPESVIGVPSSCNCSTNAIRPVSKFDSVNGIPVEEAFDCAVLPSTRGCAVEASRLPSAYVVTVTPFKVKLPEFVIAPLKICAGAFDFVTFPATVRSLNSLNLSEKSRLISCKRVTSI